MRPHFLRLSQVRLTCESIFRRCKYPTASRSPKDLEVRSTACSLKRGPAVLEVAETGLSRDPERPSETAENKGGMGGDSSVHVPSVPL